MRLQKIIADGPLAERGEWRAAYGRYSDGSRYPWWATRNRLHDDSDQEFEHFDTETEAHAWCLEIFPDSQIDLTE